MVKLQKFKPMEANSGDVNIDKEITLLHILETFITRKSPTHRCDPQCQLLVLVHSSGRGYTTYSLTGRAEAPREE